MRRFTATAPPERIAVLRILVGGYAVVWLLARAGHLVGLADLGSDRFAPVGVLAPLPEPVSGSVVAASVALSAAAGVAFVVGWRHHLTGPLFAVSMLALASWRSSWGQLFHTENLLVLHLAILAVAPAADAWSLDARRRARPVAAGADHGWPVRLCAVITVMTYVVAGWAKVVNAGWGWLDGDVLRNQVAYDNVRKALLGDTWSPLAGAVVRQAWVFGPLAVVALSVELLSPLALLGRRLRVVWVAAAWAFHVGIVALMAIPFPYPLSGVAFAPLFRTERLPAALVRRRRQIRLPECRRAPLGGRERADRVGRGVAPRGQPPP